MFFKKKLAIVCSHPIQYHSPLFKLLTERNKIEIKIFYTLESVEQVYDEGFGLNIQWDIPLLEGYQYHFVSNEKNFGKKFWDVRNPTILSEISNWRPDSVLVFGWNYYSHLKVMRYFKNKIPVYFRGDSHLLNERMGLKKLARRIVLKWVYKHIDYAFYVGSNNKSYYKAHGLKENQLRFAPHAIDNNRFFDDSSKDFLGKAMELRFRLGYKTEDIVIGFIGKFEEQKNPTLLLDVFLKLNAPNIYLLFVGNGKLEKELKNLAAKDKRIQFLGFQNQSVIPIVYRACDILALPSRSETWGLSINEAMACSRAILASHKCGCAADLVLDGYNGYIFELQGDSLFSKLEKMVESKSNLAEMGKRSFQIIQDWNFVKICEAFEQI